MNQPFLHAIDLRVGLVFSLVNANQAFSACPIVRLVKITRLSAVSQPILAFSVCLAKIPASQFQFQSVQRP